MRKRMLSYIAYLENLLKEEKDELFWQKEKGKEKDRMLCQAYAWCHSFPCMCDCMRGWFLYACKGRKYA